MYHHLCIFRLSKSSLFPKGGGCEPDQNYGDYTVPLSYSSLQFISFRVFPMAGSLDEAPFFWSRPPLGKLNIRILVNFCLNIHIVVNKNEALITRGHSIQRVFSMN